MARVGRPVVPRLAHVVIPASCPGTSDEVKTTIAYPAAGASNFVLPTSATVGAGDGSLTATTSLTYDGLGNLVTATGPLGAAQTTLYRYDAAHQVVGVVGPSPSEGGLANAAERITYNGDGNVTLAEEGTVASQSNADWANFSSLKQVATTFDAQQRPTEVTASSGGTTLKVSQFTYDGANRLLCSAVRANSATFGHLRRPPAPPPIRVRPGRTRSRRPATTR